MKKTTKISVSLLLVVFLISCETNSNKTNECTRDSEEVRTTLDSNKAAIYAIYNRALRTDDQLNGRVFIKIMISQSGEVLSAVSTSDEIKNDDLLVKISERAKLIKFRQSECDRDIVVQWAIDLLPY